jgi:hypothetical protein
MIRMRTTALVATTVAALVLLAGCGGDDSDASDAVPSTSAASSSESAPSTSAAPSSATDPTTSGAAPGFLTDLEPIELATAFIAATYEDDHDDSDDTFTNGHMSFGNQLTIFVTDPDEESARRRCDVLAPVAAAFLGDEAALRVQAMTAQGDEVGDPVSCDPVPAPDDVVVATASSMPDDVAGRAIEFVREYFDEKDYETEESGYGAAGDGTYAFEFSSYDASVNCSETGALLEWLMRDSSGAEVPYSLTVDGSECA